MISDSNIPGVNDVRCHCGELTDRPVLHEIRVDIGGEIKTALVIVHPCPVHCCELRQFSHMLRPFEHTDVMCNPAVTSYKGRGFEY